MRSAHDPSNRAGDRYTRLGFAVPAALVILVASLLAGGSTRAYAANFHQYSVGYDTYYRYTLTGNAAYRSDASNFTLSPGTNCNVAFSGTPVYQATWVGMDAPGATASNWVEIGTGHQCNNPQTHYWYWGYAQNGNWYPLGVSFITPDGANHWFETYRYSSGGTAWWYFQIDNTRESQLGWNVAGQAAETGLESYDASAVAPAHWYYYLQETTAEGPWVAWSSSKSQSVTPGGQMCGGYPNSTTWEAGENTTC